MKRIIIILAILLPIAAVVLYLEPWKSEFERERENVQKAMAVGRAMQTAVGLFYQEKNRMPTTAAEAKEFLSTSSTGVNTAAYDADKKMIVVTSTFNGRTRRFALHAEESKDKSAAVLINWTCRTIDFDVKDLPYHCHPTYQQ